MKERTTKEVLSDKTIDIQQKRYILEASTELLEFYYIKGEVDKKTYLSLFHDLTSARAMLGMGENLVIKSPTNPLESHRQARLSFGMLSTKNQTNLLVGIRPLYHSLDDNTLGLLYGTQIEFLSTLLRINEKAVKVQEFTLLSVTSLSPISAYFQNVSWRTHFRWDKNYIDDRLRFNASFGAGASWGSERAYMYLMADSFVYEDKGVVGGVAGSLGFVWNETKALKTNVELAHKWYSNGAKQIQADATQSYAFSPTLQAQLKYHYKEVEHKLDHNKEHELQVRLNYYF